MADWESGMSELAEDIATPHAASTVAVARQPIFDRAETITGFEILYRSLTGPFTDAEGATSTVIVQSLADIGLERLVGDSRAFINVTREFLLKVRPLPMPPERVVLELVGTHTADPELLEALRDAVDAGFQVALDGFRFAPGLEPLLDVASVVKLDIRALSGSSLVSQIGELRARGITAIALKVETREEYEACRAMGFDGFQGYFFAEPAVVSGRTAPTHRLGVLGQLVAPGRKASFEEIERVISQDAGLSHKLVRMAGSAFVGARQQVSSVRQALILLGTVAVRRWAMLLVLSGLTDRPQHLLNDRPGARPPVRAAGGRAPSGRSRSGVHRRAVLGGRRAARQADAGAARRAAVRQPHHARAARPRRPRGPAARRRARLRAWRLQRRRALRRRAPGGGRRVP